eukprot:CAMPEP_0182858334 /NCGR_PEP_ID=MMETSP0034_2-20130328/3611_1 /TAXON_ID=156128 /ORGANISM="Nephroselmis pyriformis, Strain CCMP717" /LENGTH=58 /DNA_ID=CAMNT_0024989735 /DNA_START=55 /DNA_END=227 /DNA_ORIENTATION=+
MPPKSLGPDDAGAGCEPLRRGHPDGVPLGELRELRGGGRGGRASGGEAAGGREGVHTA